MNVAMIMTMILRTAYPWIRASRSSHNFPFKGQGSHMDRLSSLVCLHLPHNMPNAANIPNRVDTEGLFRPRYPVK